VVYLDTIVYQFYTLGDLMKLFIVAKNSDFELCNLIILENRGGFDV